MGARVRAADSGDKGLDRRKQELGKLPQNWNEWSMKMQRMNEGCERGEIRFYLQHMVSVIHAIILWILLYLLLPNIHMPLVSLSITKCSMNIYLPWMLATLMFLTYSGSDIRVCSRNIKE